MSPHRQELAAGYAADLEEGLRRLPRIRNQAQRQRMRAAVHKAISGVLTYSDDRATIDKAVVALGNLETARHFKALSDHAVLLRRHGATIDPAAVTAAAGDAATATTRARLAELEEARQRAGQTIRIQTQEETPQP